MAEYCTLDPDHAEVELITSLERRQGYCSDCALAVLASPKVMAHNARALPRQAAKDAYIAAHPELVSNGIFTGEAMWLAYAAAEDAEV